MFLSFSGICICLLTVPVRRKHIESENNHKDTDDKTVGSDVVCYSDKVKIVENTSDQSVINSDVNVIGRKYKNTARKAQNVENIAIHESSQNAKNELHITINSEYDDKVDLINNNINKSETVEEFVDIQHSKCPSDKSQQQQLQEIPVTASAESNYEFQQTLQIQKGNQIKFICPVEHRTITKCQRKPKPVPNQSLPVQASNCSVFYCSEGCFELSGNSGNSFIA